MGWPRRARSSGSGESLGKGVSQQGSVCSWQAISHKAFQEDGWFLPHGRGGVERKGGSCPPMGESSINLVSHKQYCVRLRDT